MGPRESAVAARASLPVSRLGACGWRGALAALALFAALAAFHTWPLASAPGTLSRHDNSDAVLNEWAVWWVSYQVPRDPLHLFDANIFYPERNTLAFSEHLFVQAVMGAPLLWMGAPTVLVHNLLVLAGFALTGWTMCLVMRAWTGDWWAGVAAGMLLAFNAHTLTRIAHLQAVHVQFLPLALFALDRVLARPSARRALGLGLAFALQSLTSNYLLVFMTFGMLAAAGVRVREWAGRGRGRALTALAIAGLVAIACVLPFLWHYYEASREQGLRRTLSETSMYAASWRDYLYATGRLHHAAWSAPFFREAGTALFPGVAAILLAGVTIFTGWAWRLRPARMWLALGAIGFVLSFGTSVPGYVVLYEVFPLLQGIRASVRFGYLVLAAFAALAGFGLWLARARLAARPRLRLAVSVLAVTVATIEAARLPVGYSTAHDTPAAYRVLATGPKGAVVELPLYAPRDFHRNASYMLHATVHRRPILNGYSGFRPRSYVEHFERLRTFPAPEALAYLRALGVADVVIHARGFEEMYGAGRLQDVATSPGLRMTIQAGNLTVYRLEPEVR
jgi:hypothetical protein